MKWYAWLTFVACICVLLSECAYATANTGPRYRWAGWFLFVEVQLIMFVFMVMGWVLLIPFCLAHAWRPSTSIADSKRTIDCWSFGPLNYIYSNPEDGVSGKYAVVWVNGVLSPYEPGFWTIRLVSNGRDYPSWWVSMQLWLYAAWRAYLWSAWRNSVDALKYRFHWENGPHAEWRGHKLGWWPENGYKVPLL